MYRRLLIVCGLGTLILSTSGLLLAQGKTTPKKTSQAWTLEEAKTQLQLNPRDVYLQYVALQLARNNGKADNMASQIEQLTRIRGRDPNRRADLFALFSGAAAVQETLQLDTLRGGRNDSIAGAADPARNKVDVSDLKGPTVKSHPWGTMLAAQRISGKKPKVSELSLCVPDDQYFVRFRTLSKLLDTVDVGDLWGDHLMNQATKSAKTQQSSKRIKRQLAMQTDLLSRPFYDMVVEEVAITGSDIFFREGSDISMLFKVKQPQVFRLRMDGYLAIAEKAPGAVRSTGKILGIDYVQVATPDRSICAFSAYPEPGLHVRSNSKAGLQRVLSAVAGKGNVRRLGETTEFKYIRTLMVLGDEREDGFVYLSDPFIRRLVGAELRLTEQRRMLCYNHLRMIGHASMLYRTQYGTTPKSLEQLAATGCAPGVFGRDGFFCPCGGSYMLSDEGTTGVCSHHGHAEQMVPCCEIPLGRVTEEEAKQYKDFVEQYSRYWRRFFDPIAVRLQVSGEKYRAETIILPLIDNSVYDGLAMVLGGDPEPLDALPVPERNIFSVALRLNKKKLVAQAMPMLGVTRELRQLGTKEPDQKIVEQFLTKGIGNQIGLHVYDASPMFDFNLVGFLGDIMGSWRGVGSVDEMLPIGFLISSLNSPVYISVPVQDAEIVDKFLDELDGTLAGLARRPVRTGWFDLDFDFYRVPLDKEDQQVRCYAMAFGPIKWRMFFARIGDGLYIASKRFILDDIVAATKKEKTDRGPTAHAMARVRPENWNEVLPSYQLGWSENCRKACFSNLGQLSSVARAMSAAKEGKATATAVRRAADKLHAVHFYCPEGGKYILSPDGKQVTCGVHGSAAQPRQLAGPVPNSPIGRLMKDFSGLTIELTFLDDGLHAIVTVDRK